MKRRKALGAVARGGRDGSESTELIFETLGLGWGYLELAGTQSPLLCGSGRELAGGPLLPIAHQGKHNERYPWRSWAAEGFNGSAPPAWSRSGEPDEGNI